MINQLKTDLKEAMRTKNKPVKETIQMVTAKAQNYAKVEMTEITNVHLIKAMRLEVSQMKESLETMKSKMDELEIADYEQKIDYIESMLPKMVPIEDIEAYAQGVLDNMKEAGEVSMKQMGTVINTVKAEFGVLCDGKQVSDVVKRLLSK